MKKVTNLNRGAPCGYGQLSDCSARRGRGYPGCVPLQRTPGVGLPAAGSHSSSVPPLGPLLDTVQEANQEDVGWQVVHPAVHQDAALRAAELVPGADDVLQAAAAEGVLTRQHLGCGVQALQAHRALQQIQQRRRVVHVGGESEHLGFSVRGDAAATFPPSYRGNYPGTRNILGGEPAGKSPLTPRGGVPLRLSGYPRVVVCSPLWWTSFSASALPRRVSVLRVLPQCLRQLCRKLCEVTLSSSSHAR